MRYFVVIMFVIGAPMVARAATCEPEYYLDKGECISCLNGNPSYCPGDDMRHSCPCGKNLDTADEFIKYYSAQTGDTFINERSCWTPGHYAATSIADCRTSLYFETQSGRYLVRIAYNINKDYFWSDNPTKIWLEAAPGYYLSGLKSAGEYADSKPCTNGPANAHYTGPGDPDTDNCPWECDCGYAQSGNSCVAAGACGAGVTTLRTSTNLSFNLYAKPSTSPSLHILRNGVECYGCLAPDASDNAINVQYGGKTYHTTN